MSLERFSDDDVARMREQFGHLELDALAAMWEAYESADPSLGDPDVPHVFAVRFLHRFAGEGFTTPFEFYLALREAFFQAMSAVVSSRDPGKRWFK